MTLLLLLLGLSGLWVGSGWTIRGSVSLARHLGVHDFVVGIVVLAIGSDLPELSIAVGGAIENLGSGQPVSDIIVGSALGSGLGQIGLVLGVVGLSGALRLPRDLIVRHGSALLGSLILLGVLAIDGAVTRLEGILLVSAYVIYIALLFALNREESTEPESSYDLNEGRAWVLVFIGLLLVAAGAKLTIYSATRIAEAWQIKQSIVAVLFIGLGTSLPELAISVSAVAKRRSALSIGNLVGSNIFDTLVPVGVAATIAGIQFDTGLFHIELPFLFFLTAVMITMFAIGERLRRREAAIILLLYTGYALVRASAG